jgi:prepilin-type N-terminal cleavage/methylation domain-containing protein
MTPSLRNDRGFTLVEVLVAVTLFSILSVGFYQVMFAGVDGAQTSRNVAQISEEARVGFNRMLRDTREAGGHCFAGGGGTCGIATATDTSYSVEVDFDGDAVVDYDADEFLEFSFDAVAGTISVASLNADRSVRSGPEVLVAGVREIQPTASNPNPPPVFSYSSNYLEYDHDPVDGVTTWEEIDDPPSGVVGVGDGDDCLDQTGLCGEDNLRELFYISNISYAFEVGVDGRFSAFYGETSLRNRRWAGA